MGDGLVERCGAGGDERERDDAEEGDDEQHQIRRPADPGSVAGRREDPDAWHPPRSRVERGWTLRSPRLGGAFLSGRLRGWLHLRAGSPTRRSDYGRVARWRGDATWDWVADPFRHASAPAAAAALACCHRSLAVSLGGRSS